MLEATPDIKTLVIDVGNTAVKLAMFQGKDMLRVSRHMHDDFISTAREYVAHGCRAAILSTTVNLLATHEQQLYNLGIPLIRLDSTTPLPIYNMYSTQDRLGPDRIAAVVGAYVLRRPLSTLVIDAGTCITYDYIDRHRMYHGGAISPGRAMRLKAMHAFTDKLPLVDAQEAYSFMGASTRSCMEAGVIYGIIYEMEGFIREYESHKDIGVLLTGGDAQLFGPLLDARDEEREERYEDWQAGVEVVPNLVLIGLNHILLHNLGKSSLTGGT